MAKSAGNLERITDLVADGIDPLAFRYLALQNRYRHKLAYSRTSVRAAAAGLASLRERVAALGPVPTTGPWVPPEPLTAPAAGARPEGIAPGLAGHGGDEAGLRPLADRAHRPDAPLSESGRRFHARFVDAVDDDLDLPTGLAVVRVHDQGGPARRRAALAHPRRRPHPGPRSRTPGQDRRVVRDERCRHIRGAAPDPRIEALVAERTDRRAAGDYARADAIRAELNDLGVEVTDDPDGTSHWRRTPR